MRLSAQRCAQKCENDFPKLNSPHANQVSSAKSPPMMPLFLLQLDFRGSRNIRVTIA